MKRLLLALALLAPSVSAQFTVCANVRIHGVFVHSTCAYPYIQPGFLDNDFVGHCVFWMWHERVRRECGTRTVGIGPFTIEQHLVPWW